MWIALLTLAAPIPQSFQSLKSLDATRILRDLGVENARELMTFVQREPACVARFKESTVEFQHFDKLLEFYPRLRAAFHVDADLESDISRCVTDEGACDWIVDAVARMCPEAPRMPAPDVEDGSTAQVLLRALGAGLLPMEKRRALGFFDQSTSLLEGMKSWSSKMPDASQLLAQPDVLKYKEQYTEYSDEFSEALVRNSVVTQPEVSEVRALLSKLNTHLSTAAAKLYTRLPVALRLRVLSGVTTDTAVELIEYLQDHELPAVCDSVRVEELRRYALQEPGATLDAALDAVRNLLPSLTPAEHDLLRRVTQATGRPALRSAAMVLYGKCE